MAGGKASQHPRPEGPGVLARLVNKPVVAASSAKSGSGTNFQVLKNVFASAHYIKIQ